MSYKLSFGILVVFLTAGCGASLLSKPNVIIDGSEPPWSLVEKDPTVERMAANVVSIFYDDERLGTGFFIDRGDLVVTNAHVALSIKNCSLLNLDCAGFRVVGREFTSPIDSVTTYDRLSDLAVVSLKIRKNKINQYRYVQGRWPVLGESIRVMSIDNAGQWVFSDGEILNTAYERRFNPLFHHNANTESGMSGSPVFSRDWVLLGVHSGGDSAVKVNRAIPIEFLTWKQ